MNFWDVHGWCFLFGLMIAPRITVWFFTAVTGGFLFWLGFFLIPRVFIAILAIVNFWGTNSVLCVFAVLLCFGMEAKEKKVLVR